ncbi:class I SAM-dependent methyltransferase [Amycolatopsis sp. H20-H5]|uniref:class I SAM-dependent methyltransferase n=1 Tax=Amycolatopsis sp. H20-H5 TaxID=3046309 RepID=UPI002DBD7F6E|nr:class I SAM-dependent methyltransferase [Amycolatopsis sp. H20-H5]MEC3979272.1 class I SAM-dependent methyltransferase [Amycolatopsis sp. H20-H5]
MTDPKDIVRYGYDALSYRYREDDAEEGDYAPWIVQLRERVPAGGAVLDVGCGCGIPMARSLAPDYAVTGVDISEVQVERARRLVPGATFLRDDVTRISFPDDAFDAIVSLYALIHLPNEDQRQLLLRAGRYLKPGGWLLAITGHDTWTGTEDNWLGGETLMWWSHPDASVYEDWITEAGLVIESRDFVPEGDSGHALFWARRPLPA